MAVLPLLATIAGCAAPGPGPVAAAAAPGPDPAPGLVGALLDPDSDDCRMGGVSGHNLGTGGFSTVAKAMAYETLATGRHDRDPSDTFSLRFDRAGLALVRERHTRGWEVHRFERNPYGWVGVGSRFGSLGCPEPSEFELPGRALDVPEGRSVTRDICFGATSYARDGRGFASPEAAVVALRRGVAREATIRYAGPRRALVRTSLSGFPWAYDVRRTDAWRVAGHRGGTCPGVDREMARPGVPVTLAGRGGRPEASAPAGPPRGRRGS